MNVSPIGFSNYNQNFGSSLRVGIFVKSADGLYTTFVNPSVDAKTYKKLNSKIVGSLNTDFIQNLRTTFGIERKSKNNKTLSAVYRRLIEDLKNIDADYRRFNLTRSLYRKHKLGYIVTGSDVSVVENIKGVGQIGLAKTDSLWANGHSNNAYVRGFSKSVNQNAIHYAQSDDVVLRSKDNKEIMLRAFFKEVGVDKRGNKKYALEDYEFHENSSMPDLRPVRDAHVRYKNSRAIQDEIRKTVQYQLNALSGKRVHFSDLEDILYPKKQIKAESSVISKDVKASNPPAPKEMQKHVIPKQVPPKPANEGKQLTIDFGA